MPAGHTDSNYQLDAAKNCARSVLGGWEAKSPELRHALSGRAREVVIDMMAMTFLDGVRYGAQALMAGMREEMLSDETEVAK